MIEEQATVLKVDGEMVIIAVEKTSSCHSCNASGSCGTSSLAKWFNFKPPEIRVQNTLNASIGDRIVVAMPDSLLMSGSFLLYIVPLLSLFATTVLARFLFQGQGEGMQILAGLLGFGAGLWIVRHYSGFLVDNTSVSMIKILRNENRTVHSVRLSSL